MSSRIEILMWSKIKGQFHQKLLVKFGLILITCISLFCRRRAAEQGRRRREESERRQRELADDLEAQRAAEEAEKEVKT